MAQFREFLLDEGLPTNDDRIDIVIPVVKKLSGQSLKTIRLKKTINGVSTEFGDAFRKLGPIPTVDKPHPYLQKNQAVLNWYPKIQAMKSGGLVGGDGDAAPNQTHLTALHVAFLDLDRLYFELEQFKAERGWYNLNITRDVIRDLLLDSSWYRLLIPAEELAFDSFEKVRVWGEIAASLLKKYTERYYTFRKRDWEMPHLEYRVLEADDPNFLPLQDGTGNGYRGRVDPSDEELVAKLGELKTLIEAGGLKPWSFRGIKAVAVGAHLYEPLLYVDRENVEITPVPLNKGEWQFVEDLRSFQEHNAAFFEGRQLYLLRNLSKGKGIGFFEAGNFHPDFIAWQVEGSRQFVSFVDPKGIRSLALGDPKIQFVDTIKEIEERLGDPNVVLSSFIVSNTPPFRMEQQWGISRAEMDELNILFQDEDRDTYIETMLTRARVF
jgi:hypothetical protein